MRLNRGFLAIAAAGVLLVSGCDLLGDAAVDSGEVESQVSENLESQFGEAPADVDCPDDLPAELDASMRCIITASDGSQIGATVTVTEVDGTNVRFGFEVDDEPVAE